MPYSPLGKGWLTRPWGQQTARGNADQVAKSFDLDITLTDDEIQQLEAPYQVQPAYWW